MKYKVSFSFINRETGKLCDVGDVIELTAERAQEINTALAYLGEAVEPVTEEKTEPKVDEAAESVTKKRTKPKKDEE